MNILNRLDSVAHAIGNAATGVNRLKVAETEHTPRHDAGEVSTDHFPATSSLPAKPIEPRVSSDLFKTGFRRSSGQ